MSQAQLSTKIIFWHNPTTGHILQGAPEHFEPCAGYQKIVCNSAAEAERWSARLNDQDKRQEMLSKEDRDAVEAAQIADMRANIRNLLQDTSRSYLSRRLLEVALKKCDEMDDARFARNNHATRESYLHVEAFEDGR